MLELHQVCVNYDGSSILRDIHLRVPSGQVVCLMGRNGVGKTTLMKSIMGVLKPRSGDIYFESQRITHWQASQRARLGFGYVPQGRVSFLT